MTRLDYRTDEYRERQDNPPPGLRGPSGDWIDLQHRVHVREQVERIMPALTLIQGTATVRSVDEYVNDILIAMAALRSEPDVNVTANCGGIRVARCQFDGDNENYEICLVASKVYGFQVEMEQLSAERKRKK